MTLIVSNLDLEDSFFLLKMLSRCIKFFLLTFLPYSVLTETSLHTGYGEEEGGNKKLES